ncbi:MAG: GNAT family N-acetyltransferase [candidate division Zixibacteria bacterium]|nr:GNAT family N-acetyltransferase [candidate division Zixibacteria bacterium]
MSEPTQVKADLIPYTDEYADMVRGWIDSEETYQFVCRGKNFPPPDELVKSWQREGIASFLLFADRKPVAYGELWNRPKELAVEIAHVLVNPYSRSQGLGTKMVNLLYARGAARPDVAKVLANVYNENEFGLACLLKAGFELVSTTNFGGGLRVVKMVR